MKFQAQTVLNLIVFVTLVTFVLALMRFYPDLRRYVRMKSM